MALRAAGFVIIQATTPGESPITTGYLWADTATNKLKQCTGVAPYVWTEIGPFSGAATSAQTLTTPRNINGVAFDGSADITIPGITTTTTITSTGAQSGIAISGASVLRCNNASDLTIHGIAAGVDGQRLTITSVGAGNVFLAHQSATDSTAANRLINAVTSGPTPLAAGIGKATLVYDGTTQRWRLTSHEQGDWITPAFSASDYVGGGSMTVTVGSGDVTVNKYFIIGRVYYWTVQIDTFTTGGTPNADVVVILGGSYSFAGAGSQNAFIVAPAGGAVEVGRAFASNVSPTKFTIQRAGGANWANATNNNSMAGSIFFGIS